MNSIFQIYKQYSEMTLNLNLNFINCFKSVNKYNIINNYAKNLNWLRRLGSKRFIHLTPSMKIYWYHSFLKTVFSAEVCDFWPNDTSPWSFWAILKQKVGQFEVSNWNLCNTTNTGVKSGIVYRVKCVKCPKITGKSMSTTLYSEYFQKKMIILIYPT